MRLHYSLITSKNTPLGLTSQQPPLSNFTHNRASGKCQASFILAAFIFLKRFVFVIRLLLQTQLHWDVIVPVNHLSVKLWVQAFLCCLGFVQNEITPHVIRCISSHLGQICSKSELFKMMWQQVPLCFYLLHRFLDHETAWSKPRQLGCIQRWLQFSKFLDLWPKVSDFSFLYKVIWIMFSERMQKWDSSNHFKQDTRVWFFFFLSF